MKFVKGFIAGFAILFIVAVLGVPEHLRVITAALMWIMFTIGYRCADTFLETRRVKRELNEPTEFVDPIRRHIAMNNPRPKADWRSAGLVPAENVIRNYHIQPNAVRIGDEERDQIIEELSQHYQAGRLKLEEYGERTSKALFAVTGADLCELVMDLPVLKRFPPDALGKR